MKKRGLFCFLVMAAFTLPLLMVSCGGRRAQTDVKLNLIPSPKEIKNIRNGAGKALEFNTKIYCANAEWNDAVSTFCEYAQKMYGVNFTLEAQGADIELIHEALKSGAYRISSGESGVSVYAGDAYGFHHAFATLLQMMSKSEAGVYITAAQIIDEPDGEYRGMMVDVARTWHDFEFLLDYVDACYFYKVNVLHLHFTDSQSYTLPCDAFPKLPTESRSYTKEQISELVHYANARGIQLMPEIDLPGHCESFQKKYHPIFGLGGILCQNNDSFAALEQIYTELCALFPNSRYIHIGGDEAAIANWLNCRKCIAYAESQGINTSISDKKLLSEQMYAHFVNRLARFVLDQGKIPVAWEGFAKEVNDMVTKDLIVMSWENYYQVAPDLLSAGFQIINCSWTPMYVVTPAAHWTQEEVYNWNVFKWQPVHGGSPYIHTGLQIEPTDQVLGGQLLAWGDAMISPYAGKIREGVKLEFSLLLERLPAMAENTWNIHHKTMDYNDFLNRYTALNETVRKVFRSLE